MPIYQEKFFDMLINFRHTYRLIFAKDIYIWYNFQVDLNIADRKGNS